MGHSSLSAFLIFLAFSVATDNKLWLRHEVAGACGPPPPPHPNIRPPGKPIYLDFPPLLHSDFPLPLCLYLLLSLHLYFILCFAIFLSLLFHQSVLFGERTNSSILFHFNFLEEYSLLSIWFLAFRVYTLIFFLVTSREPLEPMIIDFLYCLIVFFLPS